MDLDSKIKEMNLPYLRLSITADCNAGCVICHNEGQKIGARGNKAVKSPSKLSQAQYAAIAKRFRSHFSHVKFTGGEPTLITNLPEIIRTFKEQGYTCTMTSNGILLDETLQQETARAGLERVNISLPGTDQEVYAKFFSLPGENLATILKNLQTINQYFDTKLNFMALEGSVPEQLLPMNQLSVETGITISILDLTKQNSKQRNMHQRIIDYLTVQVGLAEVEVLPDDFFHKEIYTFNNGGRWEVDDFRREGYQEAAFNNGICQPCHRRHACVEGPYALRVDQAGTARPCLIRTDNSIPLEEYL